MIMLVVRMAPITLSQNDSIVSEPCSQAMMRAPNTPNAAHSVAVAVPETSAPRTKRMSSSVGMSAAEARTFSTNDIFGSGGGCFEGLSSAQIPMYPE